MLNQLPMMAPDPEQQLAQRIQMAVLVRGTLSQNPPATPAGERALRATERALAACMNDLVKRARGDQGTATAALAAPNGRTRKERRSPVVVED